MGSRMEGSNLDLINQLTDNILGNLKTYLFPIIPFLIVTIKITIDNWGLTELEKLKLSNFKKFQIVITKYIFFSVVFIALMALALYTLNVNDEKVFLVTLAISLFLFIALVFIMEGIIKLITILLSFKYNYYIVNELGEPIYRIIKLSNNNLLFVEFVESDGILEFIDAKINRRYKKIYGKNEKLRKFYNSDKIKKLIFGIPIILSILLLILLNITILWVQFAIYIILLILLIIFLNLVFNYLDNKKFNKENQFKK